MDTRDPVRIAANAFNMIKEKHSALAAVDGSDDLVDLSLSIPRQAGLKHGVTLSLQDADELIFSAGNFYCEWFPCSDTRVVDEFISAVSGFLSGTFRIVEHHQWGRFVKAELQRPNGNQWDTIASSRKLYVPFPWSTSRRVLSNG